MMIDFDCGANPELTILKRFARENTNDRGETLQTQTANIILAELKKFFFLVACELE
jgi:hypothetical protein